MEDLDSLFPSEVPVELGGETFTLRAFSAKNMRPYLSITRRMDEQANAIGREHARKHAIRILGLPEDTPLPAVLDARAQYTGSESFATDVPIDYLMEACADLYIELVAVALGKTVEWVGELGIDEVAAAAAVITKLNEKRYTKKKQSAPTGTVTPS